MGHVTFPIRNLQSAICNLKLDFGTFRFPDPVALHLLDALGPVEAVEVGEQALGVGGDAQHPLAHRATDHRMPAALALAINHFLVRQHRAQRGAPVHRDLGLIGQPALIELEENPLRPLEVVRVGRGDLAVPVVGETERLELLAEAGDVALRGHARMRAGLQRVLLRRQAERIPAHRMQHIEPLHPLVAREDVRRRVALGVAHVQARAAGVGEHVEDVVLRPIRHRFIRRAERLVLRPERLPLFFDRMKRIHGHVAPVLIALKRRAA
jgi:hypothetical protein